jgi:phage/plasmid-like protein (TIGR03299 family)
MARTFITQHEFTKGIAIPSTATLEEAARISGLNFEIQRRQLAMRNAQGEELLTSPLTHLRAITRKDTDMVFQVASTEYKVVQPKEVLGVFKSFADAGEVEIESAGMIQGGKKIFALARLAADMTVVGADKVAPYILLATSFDGSIKTIAKPTAFRDSCTNSWAAGVVFSLSHRSVFSAAQTDKVRMIIHDGLEQVKATVETAQKLTRVVVDRKMQLEYVREVLGLNKPVASEVNDAELLDSIVDEHDMVSDVAHTLETKDPEGMTRLGRWLLDSIVESPGSELPGAKDTLWGAYNGVTYYVDHKRGRSTDSGTASAWFGPGDVLKTRALNVARQMVGVN